MSETTTPKLPRWVWIYGILFMILTPIGLGLVTLINAEMMFPGMADSPGTASHMEFAILLLAWPLSLLCIAVLEV